MTEIVIGTEAPPSGTRVVTLHVFVALPPDLEDPEDFPPTNEQYLFEEVEHAIMTLGFSFAHLGIYEGQRWLAPEQEGNSGTSRRS